MTTSNHYNPDSGQWDGQLPNPEITARIGPVTKPTLREPLDAKEPTYWAEHTGPWLKMAPRAVLREIARYADPATGRLSPVRTPWQQHSGPPPGPSERRSRRLTMPAS